MFVVRAIQDKTFQKQICSIVKAEYKENALAYYAADLKEDGVEIDEFISICQFYLKGDGEIVDLTSAVGRDEDEAVIVMLRAVMSFMHRCGAKFASFSQDATSEWWLKKSGFLCQNGTYTMDLEKFYTSPCKFSEE